MNDIIGPAKKNKTPTDKNTNNNSLKQVILSRTSEEEIFGYLMKKYYPNQKLSLDHKIANVLTGNGTTAKSFHIYKNESGRLLFFDEYANISGDCFDCWKVAWGYSLQEAILAIDIHLNLGLKIEDSLPQISFFNKPIQNIVPEMNYNLFQIYDKIKYPVYYSTITQQYRNLLEGAEAKRFKTSQFDYVCFSGTFSSRKNDSLKKHSGFICIDFDHVQDIKTMKQNLLTDQDIETEILFISPGGNGLKWIVRIDITDGDQSDYFKAIKCAVYKKYGYAIDKSGKDLARACFLCHDPDAYINPNYLQNHYKDVKQGISR